MDREPRTLSEDQRRALRILAAQAASQLELRRQLRDQTSFR
jgi:SOS response regulatory protein OraA/RecX